MCIMQIIILNCVIDSDNILSVTLKYTIMLIEVLKSKIHRAKVTGADLNYSGSITISEAWMRKAD